MEQFKAILNGSEWTFKAGKYMRKNFGSCDYKSRTIKISHKVKGLYRLSTAIHEMLHACLPDTSEESIDRTAHEIATILWNKFGVNIDE